MDIIALELKSKWESEPEREYILLDYHPTDRSFSGYIILSGFDGGDDDKYLKKGVPGHGYRDRLIPETYEVIEIIEGTS